MPLARFFALATAAVLCIHATPSVAGDCLKASTAGQAAEGRLIVSQAQDAAGRPEQPYILELPVAVCMTGSTPEDRVEPTTAIHVFSSDDGVHARIGEFVGRTVRVTGNPFPAHTAHHHAPIVMDISEIVAR